MIELRVITHTKNNRTVKKKKALGRGTSLVVQWLRLYLPIWGVQVQSLVGELKSHGALWPKHKTEAIL